MRIILTLLLASALAAQSATNLVLTNWTFTNLQGRIYSNTTLRTATPTNIAVQWEPFGYARVDFTNLPEDIRQKFHYDPTKAAAFIAEQDALKKQQAADTVRRAIDSRIRREFNDEKARIVASPFPLPPNFTIFQIVKDGVLFNDPANSGTLSMLWQYPSAGLVDGQRIVGVRTYPFGTYQYETVMHSSKTIPRLTTNLTLAIQKDFYDKHPDWPLGEVKPGMTPEQIQELQREQKLEAQLRGIDYSPITNDLPLENPPSGYEGRGGRAQRGGN